MSLSRNDLDAARRLLEEGDSFVIAPHERPDPDALGSSLALARGLRIAGKQAVVLCTDAVPDSCSWLPDAENILRETTRRDLAVGIVCDSTGLDRIGKAADVLKCAKELMIIDHHVGDHSPGADFAQATLVIDSTAAATAEIVYALLNHLGIELDDAIALQLMAGIVGDTGGFRFPDVTPTTLEIASRLAQMGASPSTAARQIYENRSMASTKLLGAALLSMQVVDALQTAVARITREDFARYGASDSDTDGIVNQVMALKGSEVALLFREIEPKLVRVSLRSRGKVDMNQVARKFGGGGHVAAAGCTIEMTLCEAEAAVIAEVSACMASST